MFLQQIYLGKDFSVYLKGIRPDTEDISKGIINLVYNNGENPATEEIPYQIMPDGLTVQAGVLQFNAQYIGKFLIDAGCYEEQDDGQGHPVLIPKFEEFWQ